MAEIVLGIGTSHSPMLSLTAEQWIRYSQGDLTHKGLVYPPEGFSMTYDEGLQRVSAATRARPMTEDFFQTQVDACQRGIEELSKTLKAVNPDVTVIISDDQDEWFFDDLMPTFAVYWGESVPYAPADDGSGATRAPDIAKAINKGYAEAAFDLPVNRELGRHIIGHMMANDFDIAHFTYIKEQYGGSVTRRYPKADGETDVTRVTESRRRPLPHGYSFVVNRLFKNEALPIVPVFQNTCYPPNQPTPRRSYMFGKAIGDAIRSWDSDARVAVVASGGLSHFVTDEDLDRPVLEALRNKDAETLMSTPIERLYSAASETQNWIAAGGALADTDLNFDLVEYVPVYRTPAGTGGGWGFARWQ